MTKYEYYGLTDGEKLAYDISRKESFFFRIYGDGSATVMIRTKEGRTYTYGNIQHCRRMYRNGYSFHNESRKEYIMTKKFKSAICA